LHPSTLYTVNENLQRTQVVLDLKYVLIAMNFATVSPKQHSNELHALFGELCLNHY
jgi:hypothetical protein